jgi:hypothetical protein
MDSEVVDVEKGWVDVDWSRVGRRRHRIAWFWDTAVRGRLRESGRTKAVIFVDVIIIEASRSSSVEIERVAEC